MKERHWEDNLGHLGNIMIGVGNFHCGSDVALKEVFGEAPQSPSLETFKI